MRCVVRYDRTVPPPPPPPPPPEAKGPSRSHQAPSWGRVVAGLHAAGKESTAGQQNHQDRHATAAAAPPPPPPSSPPPPPPPPAARPVPDRCVLRQEIGSAPLLPSPPPPPHRGPTPPPPPQTKQPTPPPPPPPNPPPPPAITPPPPNVCHKPASRRILIPPCRPPLATSKHTAHRRRLRHRRLLQEGGTRYAARNQHGIKNLLQPLLAGPRPQKPGVPVQHAMSSPILAGPGPQLPITHRRHHRLRRRHRCHRRCCRPTRASGRRTAGRTYSTVAWRPSAGGQRAGRCTRRRCRRTADPWWSMGTAEPKVRAHSVHVLHIRRLCVGLMGWLRTRGVRQLLCARNKALHAATSWTAARLVVMRCSRLKAGQEWQQLPGCPFDGSDYCWQAVLLTCSVRHSSASDMVKKSKCLLTWLITSLGPPAPGMKVGDVRTRQAAACVWQARVLLGHRGADGRGEGRGYVAGEGGGGTREAAATHSFHRHPRTQSLRTKAACH